MIPRKATSPATLEAPELLKDSVPRGKKDKHSTFPHALGSSRFIKLNTSALLQELIGTHHWRCAAATSEFWKSWMQEPLSRRCPCLVGQRRNLFKHPRALEGQQQSPNAPVPQMVRQTVVIRQCALCPLPSLDPGELQEKSDIVICHHTPTPPSHAPTYPGRPTQHPTLKIPSREPSSIPLSLKQNTSRNVVLYLLRENRKRKTIVVF